MKRYERRSRWTPIMVILSLLAALSTAGPAQELPPGLTRVHVARMDAPTPAERFLFVHGVLRFEPGSRFPAHVHAGPALYTLVEGSVRVHEAGRETSYRAGEHYVQQPGRALAAAHLGDRRSEMAVAFVLPLGKEATTFVEDTPPNDGRAQAPAPVLVHDVQVEVQRTPTRLEVIHVAVDLEPGVWTAMHAHPSISVATVLEGRATLRDAAGGETTVAAGDGWSREAGQRHAIGNASDGTTRLAMSFLLPEGSSLTTVPTAPPPVDGVRPSREKATAR